MVERTDWVASTLRGVAASCGLLTAVLGFAVILGWHTENTLLIQIHESFVPMQYNTALGFLLGGIGILSSLVQKRVFAGAAGFALFLIGALTLAEYLFSVSLGIDEFFMNHYVTVETSHPGRMAPNTALCFLLLGVALLLLALGYIASAAAKFVGILASLILALAFVAFSGYVSSVESAYGWGQLTRMAVHTSVGLVLGGSGIYVLALCRSFPIFDSRWISVSAGIGVLAGGLALWQAVVSNENLRASEVLDSRRVAVLETIERELESRFVALERMATRNAHVSDVDEELWRIDARQYVETIPGYQALEWVDGQFRVQWIEPLEGNEAAVGFDLTTEATRRDAILQSYETGESVTSKPIELVQGGYGFLHFAPIVNDEGVKSYIVGVFRITELFDVFTESVQADFDIALYSDGKPVYGSADLSADVLYPIDALQGEFEMLVAPNEDYSKILKSNLPFLIFFGTFVVSILVAVSVFLAQTATRNLRRASEAHAAVRVSENYLNKVIEALPIGLIAASRRGTIERANATVLKMLGYTREELIGQSVDLLVPENVQSQLAGLVTDFGSDSNPKSIGVDKEIYAIAKDKSPVPVELGLAPIRKDNHLHIIATVVDISQRKMLVAERENWRKLVEGIMENADAVIYVKSVEGQYLLVNTEFLEIFGLKESDVLGKVDGEIFPREFSDKFQEADSQVILSGEAICFEEVAPLEDGVHHYISTKFPIRDESGAIYAVAGVSTDISALKATELSLREAEGNLADLNRDLEVRVEQRTAELQAANKELDQFTYVASHDLQEPLRKQMMFSDVLKDEMGDNLSVDAARAVRAIVSGAERMQSLVRSLLALSRARNRELEFSETPLEFAVKDALSSLAMRIEETETTVELGTLPMVMGDPVLLTQLFQNLIGNAIRYTANLRPPLIKIYAGHGNGRLEIAVQDNGIGIAPEAHEAIFEPFKRLHGRAEYPGTGIGLSICRSIVDRHGGEIRVSSTPGNGSTFWITLPSIGKEDEHGGSTTAYRDDLAC